MFFPTPPFQAVTVERELTGPSIYHSKKSEDNNSRTSESLPSFRSALRLTLIRYGAEAPHLRSPLRRYSRVSGQKHERRGGGRNAKSGARTFSLIVEGPWLCCRSFSSFRSRKPFFDHHPFFFGTAFFSLLTGFHWVKPFTFILRN